MKFKEFCKKYILRFPVIELIVFAVILFLDLLSKNLVAKAAKASGNPYGYSVDVIGSFLQIHYAENTGASFSLLADKPWAQTFFLVLSGIVIPAFIVYLCFNRKKSLLLRISLAMIITGALGNFLDRAFLSYVRDFISFNFTPTYSFATFNVADSSLTIGVCLFILYAILDMVRESKAGKEIKNKKEEIKTADNEPQTDSHCEEQRDEAISNGR